MKSCSTGVWTTSLFREQCARVRRAEKRLGRYTEHDLDENKFQTAQGSISENIVINNLMLQILAACIMFINGDVKGLKNR